MDAHINTKVSMCEMLHHFQSGKGLNNAGRLYTAYCLCCSFSGHVGKSQTECWIFATRVLVLCTPCNILPLNGFRCFHQIQYWVAWKPWLFLSFICQLLRKLLLLLKIFRDRFNKHLYTFAGHLRHWCLVFCPFSIKGPVFLASL